MFSQMINATVLKESVIDVITHAHSHIREEFKHLDYQKMIGEALDKCGYTYSLDPVIGIFSIVASKDHDRRSKCNTDDCR